MRSHVHLNLILIRYDGLLAPSIWFVIGHTLSHVIATHEQYTGHKQISIFVDFPQSHILKGQLGIFLRDLGFHLLFLIHAFICWFLSDI